MQQTDLIWRMMWRCVFAGILFLMPAAVFAQREVSLDWRISDQPERAIAKTKVIVADSSQKALSEAITALAFDHLFVSFSIDSLIFSPTKTTVFGKAGTKYALGDVFTRILVDGVQTDSSKTQIEATTLSEVLEIASQNLRKQIKGDSLFLNAFTIEKLDVDSVEKRIDIFCEASFQVIKNAGLTVTESEKMPVRFLSRLAGISPRTPIRENQLVEIKKALQSSGYFSEVPDGEIRVGQSDMNAHFDTKNLPLHTFDAVLAWISKPEGGGILAGNAQLQARNFLSEGSTFFLKYDRQRPEVSQLMLDYQAEYVYGTPFGAKTGFQFFQQDSSYLTRSLYVQPVFRMSAFTQLGLRFRWENSSGGSATAGESSSVLATKSFLTGVEIDHRVVDDIFVPRKGFLLRFQAERGTKQTNGVSESLRRSASAVSEINVKSQIFLPVTNRFVLSPTLYFSTVKTDWYSETDLDRIGGATTLRGFQEGQFAGITTGWADLEARFVPDRTLYFFVFGATGRYAFVRTLEDELQEKLWSGWLRSTGFGLADKTRLGLLKISYAFSNFTTSAGAGQVHVSLRNEL